MKGISTIYDILLENIIRYNPNTNMTIKELKHLGDILYMWIINNEEDVKKMIDEYKSHVKK